MGFWSTVGGAALISSAGSLFSGSKNREFARSQRDYQARREDTAIQRRVADMRAAGINPILAVPHGAASAAGMQMGLQPDVGQAAATGMQAGAQAELSSAQAARESAQIDKIFEEIENLGVQRQLTKEQINVAKETADLLVNQASTEVQRARHLVAQGDYEEARATVESAYARLVREDPNIEVYKRLGPLSGTSYTVTDAAERALGAAVDGVLGAFGSLTVPEGARHRNPRSRR